MLESTKFYSIQHSESGTISEISSTIHSLQLGGVDGKSVAHSNNLERMILTQSIENFVGNWTLPQVNLDKNPVNATLVLLNEKGLKQDVFKIDLYTPKYDRT